MKLGMEDRARLIMFIDRNRHDVEGLSVTDARNLIEKAVEPNGKGRLSTDQVRALCKCCGVEVTRARGGINKKSNLRFIARLLRDLLTNKPITSDAIDHLNKIVAGHRPEQKEAD